MTTGLYMNVFDDAKDEKLTWHATGHMWSTIDDIKEQFALLQEQGYEPSALWEIEEVTITVNDRYPAMAITTRKKSGRSKSST